jgi:tetratricopeptide (TPR) repeat protein
VGLIAVAAAGAVVGVTLATRQTPAQPHAQAGTPGVPRSLPTPAAGRIRAAFRDWPHGSLNKMVTLGREHPKDAIVQLYLGIALLWSGYESDAVPPLRAAKRLGRDTYAEVQADTLLHPQYFQGYPPFVPNTDLPGLRRQSPLLERGLVLQSQGHQHSAERLFARAARRDPEDDQAQVAAAVGRFDKDKLAVSFSRLGPLTRKFPHSQSVRFHLGLLLAWTGQRNAAVAQFEKALALGRNTILGRDARQFLDRIRQPAAATPRG